MSQNADKRQDLKTLIIDFSKGYGGASARVLSLLQNLPSAQVALAGLENSPVIKSAKILGIRTHVVGKRKYDIRILKRLVNIIENEAYQIIDTHNIQAKFWGNLAATLTKTVLVSTIHSWYALEHGQKSLKGRFYTALELRTNRQLGAYITVSQKDREMLLQNGVPEERIELIYNAVMIDPDNVPSIREQLKFDTRIPENVIICTAVGRLVKVKGFDILIDAFKLISEQSPHLHCLIISRYDNLSKFPFLYNFRPSEIHQDILELHFLQTLDFLLFSSFSPSPQRKRMSRS